MKVPVPRDDEISFVSVIVLATVTVVTYCGVLVVKTFFYCTTVTGTRGAVVEQSNVPQLRRR